MGLQVFKEATAIASDEVVTTIEATASHKVIASNEMACNDRKQWNNHNNRKRWNDHKHRKRCNHFQQSQEMKWIAMIASDEMIASENNDQKQWNNHK